MNIIINYKIKKYTVKLRQNRQNKYYIKKLSYYKNLKRLYYHVGGNTNNNNINSEMSEYLTPKTLSYVTLDVTNSFSQLSEREKLYCYYMSKAAWQAAMIIPKQISSESPILVSLFARLFTNKNNKEILTKQYSEEDINDFLNYVAQIFSNFGNYLSYGDKKFIPNMNKDQFEKMLVTLIMNNMLPTININRVINDIYKLDNNDKILGFPPNDTTMYYSPNMTVDEIKFVDNYMRSINIEPWNTRLEKDKHGMYIVHIASIQDRVIEGDNITIKYGDYKQELTNLVKQLEKALNYVSNETDNEYNMIKAYIEHFTTGDISLHKKSQIYWIKDINPTVETNAGFIEHYRDPAGIRSEFEFFTAIVNKHLSVKYQKLVDNAPSLLELLPWGKTYEIDTFLKPDFTSLDVVTFVSSGIPLGINIPNYTDIKQDIGFKNVSLGNIIKGTFSETTNDNITFLTNDDSTLYKKYIGTAFEIQVAGHELLGHGSGKLFVQYKDGKFNFNNDSNSTYYKGSEGETYSIIFGGLSNAYEECRAECVGLLFSTVPKMYEIFECENDFDNLYYVNWLHMVRSGLMSLASYNTEQNKWTQAHSHARFVIFNVLNSVPDFIKLIVNDNHDDFTVEINKDKILGDGLQHLMQFLKLLQIYKSTANIVSASELFSKYSTVDDYYLNIRKIVVNKNKPKPIFIQPTLYKDKSNNNINVHVYDNNIWGLIDSFVTNLSKSVY